MNVYLALFVIGVTVVTLCEGKDPPPARPILPIIMPKPAPIPMPRPPPIKPAPMPMPTIPKHPRPPPTWRFRRSAEGDGKGHVGVDIYEEDKVGVVGKVRGHGDVWQSEDGRSKVGVHGEWSKVLDGPQRGKPQHRSGISFSHDFR